MIRRRLWPIKYVPQRVAYVRYNACGHPDKSRPPSLHAGRTAGIRYLQRYLSFDGAGIGSHTTGGLGRGFTLAFGLPLGGGGMGSHTTGGVAVEEGAGGGTAY